MIAYDDFDLRIRADGSGFVVSAGRGSQSADEPFELDLTLSWDILQIQEHGPGKAKELGAALFDALVRGRVRDLYQQARGGAGGDAGKGLRIRILLDSRDKRLHPLLRLPWELLSDRSAEAVNLLALDPRRPIVRTIDSIEQARPPAPGPLRRVLLVLSNPRDSEALDLDSECARVKEALGRISILPEVLPQATRSSLLDRICDGEHQIVHFLGHGTFDSSVGEGMLLLEDEHRGRDPLPASTLASFFAGKRTPRLVVLTSCRSADPGNDPSLGPFASVAAALVAAGLPAVIAMQTAVEDRSAIRFTERLYRRIVQDDPIEAAVSEARIALRAGQADTLDWAVPVLFVRSSAERTQIQEESAAPALPASPEHRADPASVIVKSRVVKNQYICPPGWEPRKK
ncbi:MAG TPA: CHAT domain-containing protein [Thermoanaerobaculia bacterium]|nr:CHAT domain-containing protein [Thermoanaerobaculia bacterium]